MIAQIEDHQGESLLLNLDHVLTIRIKPHQSSGFYIDFRLINGESVLSKSYAARALAELDMIQYCH